MTAELNQDVVAEEVVAPVQEAQEPEVKAEAPKEDPQERNWREMREALRELKLQNRELQNELLHVKAPPPPPQQIEKDEFDDIPDDEMLTKKQVVKLATKFARQAEERAQESIKRERAESVPQRLRSQFNDYDAVVSKENVEILMQTEPELAKSLYALKDDPLAQGIAAYKLLKKQEFVQDKQTLMDKAKATVNSKKPSPSTSVNKSNALSDVSRFGGDLTPELQAQLRKEMAECAKRRG